jgi:chemotaxis protein CheX
MKSATTANIALPQVLDITAAGPLTSDLLRLRGKDLVVDASGVERMGAQCVQVLLSASATWVHDGMELELADPSPAFIEGLAAMGLEVANFSARNI